MSTQKHLEPAASVIAACGGAAQVATALGLSVTTVRRWTYDKGRRGTGGVIPTAAQVDLLRWARAAGIDLAPHHFFPREFWPGEAA